MCSRAGMSLAFLGKTGGGSSVMSPLDSSYSGLCCWVAYLDRGASQTQRAYYGRGYEGERT